MIIDLNTDQLQSAVQIARSANAAITDAANLLNSVVVHNDWQCPERTEINDNTTRNRGQSLTLQADAERLYNNICYAAEQFLAAEQEVSNSFNAVDSPIASFLSKVPGTWGTTSSTDQPQGNASLDSVWSMARDALTGAGGGIANTLKKTVDVVSFGGIADALKGE